MQNPVTLLYYDSGGTQHTQTFDALRVKGADPTDDLEQFPGVIFHSVDGSFVQPTLGTRRHFQIELGVLQSYADRLFCANYMQANRKILTYTHDGIAEIAVAVANEDDHRGIQAEWIGNVEMARFVSLKVREAYIQTVFTPSNPVIPDTGMYIKKQVLIVGTFSSPESFQTNSGKLVTCDAPAGSYPAFDASTQEFSVDVNSALYQDRAVFIVVDAAVVSGNLTFQLAASDISGSGGSGNVYADIIIKVVNK